MKNRTAPPYQPPSWGGRASAVRLMASAFGLAVLSQSSGAQTVVNTGALTFGSFTAGSLGGSVTISAAGMRSPGGSVSLLNQGGTAVPAQFSISGPASSRVSISLPGDGLVFLSDGHSNSMALNGFTKNSGALLEMPAGTGSVSVGATLTVGANQVPGAYSGSFQITVIFE